MTRPWQVLAKATTDEGVLELRQRGDSDFLIVIDGRVLMNSYSRSSEEQLATLGLAPLVGTNDLAKTGGAKTGGAKTGDAKTGGAKTGGAKTGGAKTGGAKTGGGSASSPRVLIAGLGMGFTLRAALDVLPATAAVTVCEINEVVIEWCRGPLGAATNHAIADARVTVEAVDVAAHIASKPDGYDAILLDLYEGPNAASQRRDDPFYGPAALTRSHRALRKGGVLGVWSEDADAPFAKRFTAAGFEVKTHAIGTGGRKHIVYLGRRLA